MNASLIAEYAGVQVSFGLEDNTSKTLDKLKKQLRTSKSG